MNPRIYVGTYAKYNNGRLFGAWIDPSDYQGIKEFYDACRELHNNDALNEDSEHEFMFQDWEGVPAKYIGEGWLSADLWDWLSLDDNERAITSAYWSYADDSADIEYVLDRLVSAVDAKYETKSAAKRKWFWEFSEETEFFNGWPATARNYFDEDQWIADAELDSFDFVHAGDTLYVFHK